jgi:2-polyprenyl-3-methyl-5-hydroxy-6-metoxy-1,4-benzoquinol methylase
LNRVLFSKGKEKVHAGLQSAEWYDNKYENSAEYYKHYSESRYYFIWTVIVDRVIRNGLNKILDLGCGPGQVASLFRDKGISQYCGMDFSSKCIELAKQKCPDFSFIQEDIMKSDILESMDYDCVMAFEFLEHVEEDVKILERIRPGTKFYGSVPNFPNIAHVRHFSSEEEVRFRYGTCFSEFRVDTFPENPYGKVYYIIEGTKI